MNTKNELDLLKQIKKVDAPPFLLTRINQQISALQNTKAPLVWKWTFAASIIVLLITNISIVVSSTKSTTPTNNNNNIENIVSSMSLSSTNELYHE
jgi:hypothetical protein